MRRSARSFSDRPLTLIQASQLLWAAQGINFKGHLRTTPSAGALYPLETYLVAGNVEKLAAGCYRYDSNEHQLEVISDKDVRSDLCTAALGQSYVADAPALILLTAVYSRMMPRYGDRGVRYAIMEAGHAAQNMALQAAALSLGTVAVGSFDDEAVTGIMNLPEGEAPLYILPVGRIK